MISADRRIPIIAALALAGLVAASASAALVDKDNAGSGPVRCEIRDRVRGNIIFLEPVVHADKNVSGTYSVSVTGAGAGGSSSIRQGGEFTATAGRPTTLGQMSVGAAGAFYDVKLKVTAAGTSVSCTRQVTGAI
ncbi:curli-like amyloid fiber formation chaperone CsgH [Mesorhizobium sp. SP-1A]|uniref:curli-like amyloid fiber formation chaperone CsgH n=1 Tax=Mesorhizobium sp. SP-1A TaxID=3077840 RepID=UPI0028F746D4|nr:curli-like amyloid fiber formation chaperone CsgH [Mesorhizobium sp. SP-1A]